jgi:phosphopantothenoylcysteine decarboxylase/phosphopantothenate--cysteine ligase
MNPAMWNHPATLASVERLQKWGARFVELGVGRTACGEVGEGRLAEPDEIVAAIEAARPIPAANASRAAAAVIPESPSPAPASA